MNDHDLLARLAEIEGGYYRDKSAGPPDVLPVLWNPLINDGEAMALVKKYRLWISDDEDGRWITSRPPHTVTSITFPRDQSLNRAIVMAVVASKES